MRSSEILNYIRVAEHTAESFLPAAVPCFRGLHVQSRPQKVEAMTDK